MKGLVLQALTTSCALWAIASCGPAYTDNAFLLAQFQDPNDNSSLRVTECSEWSWYDIERTGVSDDELEKHWVKLRQGYDFEAALNYSAGFFQGQDFLDVDLEFSFPFFGRMVNKVSISSDYALLTGDRDADVKVPSHIAVYMAVVPPDSTDVKFADTGEKLVVQWRSRFYSSRSTFKIQASIYKDGSMTFIYSNFLERFQKVFMDHVLGDSKNFKRPEIVGLQDGWGVEATNGGLHDVYVYPPALLERQTFSTTWNKVQITPDSNLCQLRDTRSSCEDASNCLWCSGTCLHEFERKRESSGCVKDCTFDCPTDYDPVCGSNGISYSNECEMKRISCETGSSISLKAEGACIEAMDDVECPKMCPAAWEPLCASNGQTFGSECMFRTFNCHASDDQKVSKVHDGKCDPDYDYSEKHTEGDDSEADDYSNNEEGEVNDISPADDQKSEDKSDDGCEHTCNRELIPVCLNKVRQFNNECMMKLAVCLEKIQVDTIDDGFCEARDNGRDDEDDSSRVFKTNVDCTNLPVGCPRSYDPVCASNGKTYKSKCLLRQVICENHLDLGIVHEGTCNGHNIAPENRGSDDQGGDEDGESDAEDCDPSEALCPRDLDPVCGSDGQTYNNECLFDAAQKCNFELKLDYDGPCKEPGTEEEAAAETEEEVQHAGHHTLSRILKGIVFLSTSIGIAMMSLALYRMYVRSSNRQQHYPYPQGDTAGLPQVHQGQMEPSAGMGGGPAPAELPPFQVPVQSVAPTVPSFGPGGQQRSGNASSTVRYDRLPLVSTDEDAVRTTRNDL